MSKMTEFFISKISNCDLYDDLSGLTENIRKRNFVIVEVCGAIGSGKTATTEELEKLIKETNNFGEKDVQVEFIYEDITSAVTKKAIDDFYSGRANSAELESVICGTRFGKYAETILRLMEDGNPQDTKVIVSDRSLLEDLPFIDKLLQEEKDEDTLLKLSKIKENIINFVTNLTNSSELIHFFLNPSLETSLQRIKKRGRPSEKQIDLDLLGFLTLDIDEVSYADTVKIDNSIMTAEETALMLFERLYWTVSAITASVCQHDYFLLVSFYGVPGCGKTSALKFVERNLCDYMPRDYMSVEDASEDETIVDMQKKIYTNDEEKPTPEQIQKKLDDDRAAMFEVCDKSVFTDIGPLTSDVFRVVTGCEENDSYREKVSSPFNIFVNVLIEPKTYGDVLNHIKERGRPGEVEGLSEEYLRAIHGELENQLKKSRSENIYPCHNVVCKNDYTKSALLDIFHATLRTMRNAIVGHFR